MTPSLCLVTPTVGRPTLTRTLESGVDLQPQDQWIIIGDGVQPEAREMVTRFTHTHHKYNVDYYEMIDPLKDGGPAGDYGNACRDLAMRTSDRDYFVFIDDDDILALGAIGAIKATLAEGWPNFAIFRMQSNNEIYWKHREVTPGNVGGSMFCPRNTDSLGRWDNGAGHRSDFVFIETSLKNRGPGWRQSIRWSDEIIIICKPENEKNE